MSETLLVLSASAGQMPLLLRARQLGCRVITVDPARSAPGHLVADAAYHIQNTDFVAIETVARREGVTGVTAGNDERALYACAYLHERLGLTGFSTEAVQLMLDPALFSKLKALLGYADGRDRSAIRSMIAPGEGLGIFGAQSRFQQRPGCLCAGILRQGKVQVSVVLELGAEGACGAAEKRGVSNDQRLIEQIERLALALMIKDTPFECQFRFCGQQVEISRFLPVSASVPVCRRAQDLLDVDLLGEALSMVVMPADQSEAPWASPSMARNLGFSIPSTSQGSSAKSRLERSAANASVAAAKVGVAPGQLALDLGETTGLAQHEPALNAFCFFDPRAQAQRQACAHLTETQRFSKISERLWRGVA